MASTILEVVFKGTDDGLSKMAGGIGGSFSSMGKSVASGLAIGATAIAGIGVAAGAMGVKLVGLGSDAAETSSLIEASLGSATESYTSRLKEFASQANRSFYELQEGSSTIIAMTKSMGASENQAADFGVTFSQMSSDLGSFFNQTDSQVLEDIQSALAGSSETMLKYGIDVKVGTLNQMALNQGMIETGETLTALQKAQLIEQAIMKQGADAMGDAIRTSDGWANSLRGLKAQFTDAATEAGSKLIPAIQPLLVAAGELAKEIIPLLIQGFEWLIPYIKLATEWIAEMVRVTIAGEGPLVDIYNKIIAVKDAIMEFLEPVIAWIKENVELNDVLIALAIVLGGVVLAAIVAIAQAIGPVILAVTALIGVVVLVRKAWEALQPTVKKVTDFFTQKVFPILKGMKDFYLGGLISGFNGIRTAAQSVLDIVEKLTLGLIDINIPDVLTPGSPTPFEKGLKGIRNEMGKLYGSDLPALNNSLQGLQTTNNRNQNVNQTTYIYTSKVDTRGESTSAVRFAMGGI